jgi:quinoprotein glucose dehydrogenase
MNITSTCLLLGLIWGAGLAASARHVSAGGSSTRAVPSVVGRSPEAHNFSLVSQNAAVSVGAYTASQADRGKVVYDESCSSCHGASLRGGANEFAAPALAGPFFYEKWTGRTVEELFRYAVEKMPPEQTSKLSEAAYLDVTAYILQVLKYPAGTAELSVSSPVMKEKIAPRQ